jgi:hypothetical protein
MTFLAPAFLAAAAGIAALVVALHFISTREPATVPLPTARFAPNRSVRARSRAIRPSDLLLLVCRAGLILCAGAALAKPIPAPSRRPLARIVMVDRSRAVASTAESADSARGLLTGGDVLVLFDSAARRADADSLASLRRLDARGSLSAALVAALRAAVSLRDQADSLELVIVSPLLAEEVDQATDSIRALWPGSIRLARVAGRRDSSSAPVVRLEGRAEDPIRWALPPMTGAANPTVRIVRGVSGPEDSSWVSSASGTLVLWPETPGSNGVAEYDSVGAVVADAIVVVAPFARGPPLPAPPGSRIVARWMDGSPAATEAAHQSGCIRSISIPVPSVGDLVLDPRFQRLAAHLTSPCDRPPVSQPLDSIRLAALIGSPGGLVAGPSLPRPVAIDSPITPWLLGAALVLGLGELVLRRRRGALAEP